jgi:ectoine hydroxylase-related dioxygenase (phytanoyl-CoA dioxygenase family)
MALADLSRLFPGIDFVGAHRSFVADDARRTLAGAGTTGLAPIALVLHDDGITLVPGEIVEIVNGVADAATCVVRFVDASAFADFFHELRTVPGAQVTGTVRYERGGYAEFDAWEPALRALYQGRSIYDPGTIDRARAARSFEHGVDSTAVIGAHVGEFGFAVVRNVFTAGEVMAIGDTIARLERESTPETAGTWWTRLADGDARVCQIHYTTERAPEIAWIDTDARVCALVDASVGGLVPHADRSNGHFAVLKQPGATGGLTDLPWHLDCGLGGHSLLCPGIHIGIQLTASNPAVGAFAVLAGSHESSVRRGAVDDATWPVIVADTRPGDVTIHVPHVFHAAPPPTGNSPGRRTLYLGYGQPEAHALIGPGRSFDDLLSGTAGDGFVAFDPDDVLGPS